MSVRVRVLVSGRVQGVGFRWHCAQIATVRGVDGYVRNLPDGRVEAVFEGPREPVDAMVAWCAKGPRGAHVSGVERTEEQPEGLVGFDMTR